MSEDNELTPEIEAALREVPAADPSLREQHIAAALGEISPAASTGRPRFLAVAAAVVVLLGGGLALARNSDDSSPPSPPTPPSPLSRKQRMIARTPADFGAMSAASRVSRSAGRLMSSFFGTAMWKCFSELNRAREWTRLSTSRKCGVE